MAERKPRYHRDLSTIEICRRLEEDNIFDRIIYNGQQGQPGVFVTIGRKDLEALLNRVGTPSQDGYGVTRKKPNKLTYLSIKRYGKEGKHFGTYDPFAFVPVCCKHCGSTTGEKYKWKNTRFEKYAKKDSELNQFLEDIIKYFS